jgi:atypical dual specificity phosphatase
MSEWFVTFGLAAVDSEHRLFIGAIPTDHGDVGALSERNIEVVVNLCKEDEYPDGARVDVETALTRAGIDEQRFPFTDHGDLAAAQLDAAVGEVVRQLDSGRRVYVHCRAGRQRSSAVATAALALREGVSLDEALDEIRRRKPDALPLEHQWLELKSWYQKRVAGEDGLNRQLGR